MAVLNLFLNGRAHIDHIQLKSQRLTGPGMVAIQHDRIAFDFDHIENGFTTIGSSAAQLTAHFDAGWKVFFGHGLQQTFVALAKRICSRQNQGGLVALLLAI